MQEVDCEIQGCVTHLKYGCGHSACRRHCTCRLDKIQFTVWWPKDCQVCMELIQLAFERPNVSSDERKMAKLFLRTWAKGFAKNNPPNSPYLPSEHLRQLLR